MKKKTHRITEYYNTCKVCGKDFEVSKNSTNDICYSCKCKREYEDNKKKYSYLLDATIIEIEPESEFDELSSVKIKTQDGEIYKFTAGGHDERYIEIELMDEKTNIK